MNRHLRGFIAFKEESEIWKDVFFLSREMSDILQFNVRLKLVAKLLYYKVVPVMSPSFFSSLLHNKYDLTEM